MNQISPLYKIALLLCSSVCLQICCTPPTAPPTESEREKFDSSGDVVEIHLPRALHGKVPIIQQCFAHALILLESTSILASELYPRLADLAGPIVVVKPNVVHITPTFIVATTVMIASALARLACYRALGNLFTFQLAIRKEHRLVTSGPYAIIRHPGYTAFLVFEIAQLAAQFGRGSWWYESGYWGSWCGRAFALGWMWLIGNASWFFVTRAEQEDQVLQREFGKEWERWSKRTPYKLVPYIW